MGCSAQPATGGRRDGLYVGCRMNEVGLAVVTIAVVMAVAAAVAGLFELAAALLSLATALAVFVDGFLQIVFRLLDVTSASVVVLGTGGYRHSG